MTTIAIEDVLPKIAWHITNNFIPAYSQRTVDGMLQTVRDYLEGKLTLDSPIVPNNPTTVGELFDDLKINDFI